jgi:hypothetical protein
MPVQIHIKAKPSQTRKKLLITEFVTDKQKSLH